MSKILVIVFILNLLLLNSCKINNTPTWFYRTDVILGEQEMEIKIEEFIYYKQKEALIVKGTVFTNNYDNTLHGVHVLRKNSFVDTLTVSDVNGSFCINTKFNNDDTLVFHLIGYRNVFYSPKLNNKN